MPKRRHSRPKRNHRQGGNLYPSMHKRRRRRHLFSQKRGRRTSSNHSRRSFLPAQRRRVRRLLRSASAGILQEKPRQPFQLRDGVLALRSLLLRSGQISRGRRRMGNVSKPDFKTDYFRNAAQRLLESRV